MVMPSFSTFITHLKAASGTPDAPEISSRSASFQALKPGAFGSGKTFTVSASFGLLILSVMVPHDPADSLGWAPAAAHAKVPLGIALLDGDRGVADSAGAEALSIGTSRASLLLSDGGGDRLDMQSSQSIRGSSSADLEDDEE